MTIAAGIMGFFADLGYGLSSGKVVLAGQGKDLLNDKAVGQLFLGG